MAWFLVGLLTFKAIATPFQILDHVIRTRRQHANYPGIYHGWVGWAHIAAVFLIPATWIVAAVFMWIIALT